MLLRTGQRVAPTLAHRPTVRRSSWVAPPLAACATRFGVSPLSNRDCLARLQHLQSLEYFKHASVLGVQTTTRSFHSTRPRRDILFVSAPLFKQSLLYLVRITLLVIPFVWRYKLFKRYPRPTRWLLWVPLAGISLVVALGLDQSERTSRWRLLLMTEREEIEWSNQRFDELMATESLLLLPPDDARVAPLRQVCDRLVQALNDESPVSFAEQARIEKIRQNGGMARRVVPSATTQGLRMPYRPETGNPEKILAKDGMSFQKNGSIQKADQHGQTGWAIYVIDAPVVNSFVTATRDIFCYTGLLALTEGDDDLLAAVIGHEIEHLQERHIVESLGFMALSGVVFDVLRGFSWALTLSFPIVGDALSSAFTFVDRKLSQRAYSRKLETEADWLGMELMAKAGYDPRAAIRLWEILNEAEEDVEATGSHAIEPKAGNERSSKTMIWDHIALLRTHPTGHERLAALKEHLPRAMEIYREAKEHNRVEQEVRIAREVAMREQAKSQVREKRIIALERR
ncbi:M48 family metallopeptidase [Sporobolomyces koalae]|uniref:M48 family metallopeptidase n=1 Tax=Sporobolomyces koalae TaxID=500713 RepID=UPI003171941A